MNLKEFTASKQSLKKTHAVHPVIELELRVKNKKRMKQEIWDNARARGWL